MTHSAQTQQLINSLREKKLLQNGLDETDTAVTSHEIAELRALLLSHLSAAQAAMGKSPQSAETCWWLLGTVGCHLCDEAENLLQSLQMVADIEYATLDIADLPEPLMMAFAHYIPVLLLPSHVPQPLLAYPFSLVELHALA